MSLEKWVPDYPKDTKVHVNVTQLGGGWQHIPKKLWTYSTDWNLEVKNDRENKVCKWLQEIHFR